MTAYCKLCGREFDAEDGETILCRCTGGFSVATDTLPPRHQGAD